MDARKFRCLFENADDGLVHSGCIWDTERDKITNFAYVCGMRNQRKHMGETEPLAFRFAKPGELLHIFVMATFSAHYIKVLLRMLREKEVDTVIFPYVVPLHRVVMLQWYKEMSLKDEDFRAFLEHPYLFLKKAGVKHVYQLYGNGAGWIEGQEVEEGHYFELVNQQELQAIEEMEGGYIPVMKAGYIVDNDWVFYFGHYGKEINMKKFGDVISSTIVMYHGPLHASGKETDSVLTGRVFTRQNPCEPYFDKSGKNCLLKCIHSVDHCLFRGHKSRERDYGCFGMMLTGNIDMNKYMQDFVNRFNDIFMQVRAITIPCCGDQEHWNRQCLTILFGEDMREIMKDIKYWICSLDRATSSLVISDVVVGSPLNRIVTISEDFGCCFSGYLIPYVDEVL